MAGEIRNKAISAFKLKLKLKLSLAIPKHGSTNQTFKKSIDLSSDEQITSKYECKVCVVCISLVLVCEARSWPGRCHI